MFNQTKYTRWYYDIITNVQKSQQEGYGENHHIIPKSLGGDDSHSNLVRLAPREHYLCHALLVHMVDNPKHIRSMYAAFNMMHIGKDGKRYTSKLYQYYKVKFYKLHSEQQKGKVRSLESRQKQSRSSKGKAWSEKKKASAWAGPTATAINVYKAKTEEFVGKYDSISQAAKELSCDASAIWRILRGRKSETPSGSLRSCRTHHGYTFDYAKQLTT